VDAPAFLAALEAGRLPAVALLHGPDAFLVEDLVAAVTRRLFSDPGQAALARDVIDAREEGLEAVVRAALTLPFLVDRRLVVARGVEAVAASKAALLEAYLRDPNPATVLLIAAAELSPQHWLTRVVPAAQSVQAMPPVGRALVSWLRRRAAAEGIELSEEAAALLVELAGDDPAALLTEAGKAALAGGPEGRRVTAREVRAVVGEHRVRHVFELGRALERGDRAAAMAVLENLLAAGEEPLAVLGLITREARTAWQVQGWLAEGRSPDGIVSALRRPPAAASAALAQAPALAPGAGRRRMELCWDAERRLKLGAAPRPELALLVAELCAG
jgi:DNA polymerase-3 subunit delta